MFRRLALLLIAPMLLGAVTQPAPVVSGVANAASNLAPGLPASGIAQGSIFSVYGTNLGPSSCNIQITFPLSNNVCEVTLTVTVNGTSVFPIPLYIGPYQINAILPSLTPVGTGTITVTYSGASAPVPIQVVSAAFGVFTSNSNGSGQASVTDANYKVNTIIHTLHPGDVGILWGTGLGASASDVQPPTTAANIGSPTLYVGNTPLTLSTGLYYAGRSGAWPGLDQINFTVPAGVQGCYVPIGVAAGGGSVGNIGTIAVAPVGQNTCSDSVMGPDMISKLASGGNVNFGYIRLEGITATVAGLSATGTGRLGDYAYATFSHFYAYATFSHFTPQTVTTAEYGVSSGYCVSTGYFYGYNTLSDLSIFNSLLDAGSALSIQGPLVTPGPISQIDPPYGYYNLFLSSNAAYYLYSDYKYTVAGTGGANVGAFTVTDTTSTPSATLTGLANDQNVPRSSPFTVQWTFANNNLPNVPVTIGGFSESSDFNQFAAFECTAPAGATTFTIPSWVLSTLPPSGTQQSGSFSSPIGFVWVGQYNTPTTFTPPGLDKGIITDAFFQGKIVNFQ
jgi:uncharacterized protein (TIGR03437 family)